MAIAYRQLPLAFGHSPSLAGEDFLVASSNHDAVRWLERWPDWPSPAVLLWGAEGCGKTHLAHVFLERCRGVLVDHQLLRRAAATDITARAPACVVDDADRAVAAGLEEPLLHLYNALAESRRHLLLTARAPASRWPIRLADLGSRLNAATAVGIGVPDDPLIAGLMAKLFSDRRLAVDDEVILYAVSRLERSFDAVRRFVAEVDAAALAGRRSVTRALVRAVLCTAADGEADGADEPSD